MLTDEDERRKNRHRHSTDLSPADRYYVCCISAVILVVELVSVNSCYERGEIPVTEKTSVADRRSLAICAQAQKLLAKDARFGFSEQFKTRPAPARQGWVLETGNQTRIVGTVSRGCTVRL
ncbi:hypothetical protein HPP92_018211 [Vanilla planifolia]|uniref:Uncharacterized protein n=1 Tax=Vanilla planifolia TaxID=51239 RepID=A0A835UPQ4_VANPL|nr:hypothetical protein HPP92_018796 [Vanilla planifolia]KAG0468883.1 hypothetical protein HPP92_018211 [Vanilla planifolia]